MKILSFSPHAAFDVHAIPEAIVLNALGSVGCEIVQVNCDGAFANHCLCMSHINYDNKMRKRLICASCKRNRDKISKYFKFKSILIERFLSDEVIGRVKEIIRGVDDNNFLKLNIDGHPIGQYSLYEFYLNHKLSSVKVSGEHWFEYVAILENCLKTYYSLDRIIDEFQPSRVVTYNSLYSVNRVVCSVAERKGVPHFTLHAGHNLQDRLQQITIFKGIESQALANKNPVVDLYRELPLNLKQLEKVRRHVVGYIEAKSPWVYTKPSRKISSSEMRRRLNVRCEQKVILAVMRSNDERMAATLAGMNIFNASPLFKSQIEWLKWLNGFAMKNSDYKVIFRIHPREYPNKRESVLSEGAIELQGYVDSSKLCENLYVNLPSDDISLHDLFKITDLVLNNSSTVGLEASLFGIPVLGIGDDLYSFDPFLQIEADSIDDYIAKIIALSNRMWSFDRVKMSYRWLSYLNHEVAVDISDVYRPLVLQPSFGINNIYYYWAGLKKMIGLSSVNVDLSTASSRIPDEVDRLVYAIMSDKESHIGCFRAGVGDYDSEHNFIAMDLLARARMISSPDDGEFFNRIRVCISG